MNKRVQEAVGKFRTEINHTKFPGLLNVLEREVFYRIGKEVESFGGYDDLSDFDGWFRPADGSWLYDECTVKYAQKHCADRTTRLLYAIGHKGEILSSLLGHTNESELVGEVLAHIQDRPQVAYVMDVKWSLWFDDKGKQVGVALCIIKQPKVGNFDDLWLASTFENSKVLNPYSGRSSLDRGINKLLKDPLNKLARVPLRTLANDIASCFTYSADRDVIGVADGEISLGNSKVTIKNRRISITLSRIPETGKWLEDQQRIWFQNSQLHPDVFQISHIGNLTVADAQELVHEFVEKVKNAGLFTPAHRGSK
jgi:hypothetical protein